MSRALAISMVVLALLLVAMLALLLVALRVGTQAQGWVEVRIGWVAYVNPTEGGDSASGVCVFEDYVAVVGEASGRPYVALLRKSDGGVMEEWVGDGRGRIYNCISVEGRLYAVGYTRVAYDFYGVIYVFDKSLNVLARAVSGYPSKYYSLAYDGRALYIGGLAYEDVDGDGGKEWVWLVEKRDPEDLSIVASRRVHYGSWRYGWLLDVGVEPSTGRIWAIGSYNDPRGREYSLIVLFDDSLRVFRVIDYPEGSEGYLGELRGIAFDGRRYAYIAGEYGVAKFSVDGELVAIDVDEESRPKIVYSHDHLYVFGIDYTRGYMRHILDIHDTNLEVVRKYVLSKDVNANSYLHFAGRPALEGSSIYVAGFDDALGKNNTRIVVYSLSLESATTTTTPRAQATTTTLTVLVGLAVVGVVLAVAALLLRRG